MNSYLIEADVLKDLTLSDFKAWLIKNGCPKAAGSARVHNDRIQFRIDGNVSAMSIVNVLTQCGNNFKVDPIGLSEPLPQAMIYGNGNAIVFG